MTYNLNAIFAVNFALIIADASVGYHMAPLLMRINFPEQTEAEVAVKSLRRLLSGVVALFMFFNCLAWFNGEPVYLLMVTGAVLLDIILQAVLRGKFRGGAEG